MSLEDRHRREHRSYTRAWRWGLVLSLVVHGGLFLMFSGDPVRPDSPFSAAGERQGDIRAAHGGGMEAVRLSPPPRIPAPPPPVAVALLEMPDEVPPEPEVVLDEVPATTLQEGLAVSGAGPPLDGPGRVDGTGAGDGGTEAEGRFRVIPPRPRGLILPPGDRPNGVRGTEVEVWVYVSPAGQVVPDSTRLFPPTGDRRFDRRLREHASGWVFEAARRDGRAVAEWFRYTIIM